MKLGQISAGISYDDIIQEKTKQYPNVDRTTSLSKAIKAVASFNKQPPGEYKFEDEPIHYTLNAIASCGALAALGFTSRGIHFIASLMTQ